MDARNANGANLYEYCLDNPINREDTTGHASKWLVSGVVNGVISALSEGISTFVTNKGKRAL